MTLRRKVLVLAPAALALCPPATAAGGPPAFTADAAGLVAAFDDICTKTQFSPDAVEAAFTRRGWRGERVQSPTQASPFSTWSFGTAQLTVGYRPLGPGLVTYSCGIVVRSEAGPDADGIRQALRTRFHPARLRRDKTAPGLRYQAHLKDSPSLQAILTLAGDKVPFARKGAVELLGGVLIDYTETRGPHARDAMRH